MPDYITIITPIKKSDIEPCRQYLRENAEPEVGMRCRPQFRFDLIPNLHFASFVILDAAADFGPSLVFEATFDGTKARLPFRSPARRWRWYARALSALRRLSESPASRVPNSQKNTLLATMRGLTFIFPAIPAAPLRKSRTRTGYI